MQYMTHPKHGAYHAQDEGEIERLEKSGWKQSKMPTAAEINAAKAGQRAAVLKAELAALEPVAEAPVKKKPGRKPKVAA
jgi:hypothetical protein